MKKSFRVGAISLFLAGVVASLPASAAVFHPESYRLANGLQVVIVPNKLSAATQQMVWYKVGEADEKIPGTGLAHYLEHLMFRGTPQLPAGAFSRLVAAQGGEDNAFTGRDATAFHETVASDRLPLVMQMEADRMQNLSIDPVTAKTELQVVLSERQERTDNDPSGPFWEKIQMALFGAHPYGSPVIGWKERMEAMTPEDAQSFYHAHYAPNNAVLIVSGNVTPSRVLSLAAATFGRVPARAILPRQPLPPAPPLEETRVEVKDARVKQAHIGLHCAAPSYGEGALRQSAALEIADEALSGGEVGLLYRDLVVRQSLASGVEVSYDGWTRGPSIFSVIAVPAPETGLEPMEKALRADLASLLKQGLPKAQIRAAQKRLIRSAVFARDNLSASGQALGAALTTGRTISDVETWPDLVRSIRPSEVQEALQKVLAPSRCVTGLLLPETEAP